VTDDEWFQAQELLAKHFTKDSQFWKECARFEDGKSRNLPTILQRLARIAVELADELEKLLGETVPTPPSWMEATLEEAKRLLGTSETERTTTVRSLCIAGNCLWVATLGDKPLVKLDLASGKELGRYDARSPAALVFDGENLWVSENYNRTVLKLNAQSGDELGRFEVGSDPTALAFDGKFIWVAIVRGLVKLRVTDGHRINRFDLADLGFYPHSNLSASMRMQSVLWAGKHIWVGDHIRDVILKLRPGDGRVVEKFSTPKGLRSLISDGTHIWAACSDANCIIRIPVDGSGPMGRFETGNTPWALAFDGVYIWVANLNSKSLTKFDGSKGETVATYPLAKGPVALACDGSAVWVGYDQASEGESFVQRFGAVT
jgi:outer membrane protein assembly factor BamB